MSIGDHGYWDRWNRTWRFGTELDTFMQRQRETALAVVREHRIHDARILDIGCGTGWLGHELRQFGRVWGIDLSADAIQEGGRKHPDLTLICGNFLEMDLPGPFDVVVSADALPHMSDYEGFFHRISELVKPGGLLLLMTQNPFVWQRRSSIRHVPDALPHAHPREWPSRSRITRSLQPAFVIERLTTLDPGGDQGWLWWVENRYVRRGMGLLVGRNRWRSVLERLGVGRELVIVARRQPA